MLYVNQILTILTITLLSINSLSKTFATDGEGVSPLEKARSLYERINSVPPRGLVLEEMKTLIEEGHVIEAAKIATQGKNFINITVTDMARKWLDSNGGDNIDIPLNDFVATIAGFVKDNKPFNEILYTDVVYEVDGSPVPYAIDNNDHYRQAELRNIDLSKNLIERKQSDSNPQLASENVAGIMTTRAFSQNYLVAGTNRLAGFAFPAHHVFCKGLENVMGVSQLGGSRIRVDVTRTPSNHAELFKNDCMQCHSVNDAVSQSFCSYEWDEKNGKIVYLPNAGQEGDKFRHSVVSGESGIIHPGLSIKTSPNVAAKCNKAGVDEELGFTMGYQVVNDSWTNAWTDSSATKNFGWHEGVELSGLGPKSYGKALTQNDQFQKCMATHVFKSVCYHKPETEAEKAFIEKIAQDFRSKYNYNLRDVFERTGVFCINEEVK